jgi:hypothetical protein
MRTIRASEISSFLFCKRAWWYQQKGIESNNIDDMVEGNQLHQRHGRAVLSSSLTRVLAYGLLLIALVIFTVYLTNLFL